MLGASESRHILECDSVGIIATALKEFCLRLSERENPSSSSATHSPHNDEPECNDDDEWEDLPEHIPESRATVLISHVGQEFSLLLLSRDELLKLVKCGIVCEQKHLSPRLLRQDSSSLNSRILPEFEEKLLFGLINLDVGHISAINTFLELGVGDFCSRLLVVGHKQDEEHGEHSHIHPCEVELTFLVPPPVFLAVGVRPQVLVDFIFQIVFSVHIRLVKKQSEKEIEMLLESFNSVDIRYLLHLCIFPQVVDVVESSGVRQKYMYDHIRIVHRHPEAVSQSIDRIRFFPRLLNGEFPDRVINGRHMTWRIGIADDHEFTYSVVDFGQVHDFDIMSFFLLNSLNRSTN